MILVTYNLAIKASCIALFLEKTNAKVVPLASTEVDDGALIARMGVETRKGDEGMGP